MLCPSVKKLVLAAFLFGIPLNALPLESHQALAPRAANSGHLKGKFLHVTDIHIDPNYMAGSDPDQLCHRKSEDDDDNTAGKFGALHTKCDSPIPLVEASFKFMKESLQDVDFIIYTGDTARHDRDDDKPRTKDDVLHDHKAVVKYFMDTYDVGDIPFIPTIGNNDPIEHNEVVKKDALFDDLKTIWKPFQLDLKDSFDKGGYFYQDVIPGKLRVISLNTMFFYKKNDDVPDCDEKNGPGAVHLSWLEDALKDTKKSGSKAYLIGHVPPNDDDDEKIFKDKCHSKYINLLGKYSDVITGHFTDDMLSAVVKDHGDSYGHVSAVHKKKKLKDINADRAVTVMFNAPSILPSNNPAIRVYEYDTGSGDLPAGTIKDWNQYYVDLKKANKEDKVTYEKEYQASRLFGINHFDAAGIKKIFKKIATDKKLRKQYSKYVKVSRKD
ncbi:Metallo-dependent phosphatase-like protein [Radiomyces spectabilis]|uniref:Metallo-dependent phosphatase-like protein n=1 Tax=Radiomyces spectabilis TaxID=64574 RepID=UPI0022208225|nr:Metallo-dependent phosphatase-like protein [Radiomyces spectabilis]KAI8369581.1 Metallo-dependent phosphatase-like protein [Radiomyces spectabilis]